jgi:hypothetical protein
MFPRPLLLVGVLAAAVAVPYFVLDKNVSQSVRGQWNRLTGKGKAAEPESQVKPPAPADLSAVAYTAPPVGIEEAFRFEIRPNWVMARFSNVSTVAGDPKQLGMRVALVTGTRTDDLAGSLTYYFDEYHQLQRITFSGRTGDARRLLGAIVPVHGLKSLPTTGAAYYVAGDAKKPTSQVAVNYVPNSDQPNARLEVALDLRRKDIVGWEQKQIDTREPKLAPPVSFRRW